MIKKFIIQSIIVLTLAYLKPINLSIVALGKINHLILSRVTQWTYKERRWDYILNMVIYHLVLKLYFFSHGNPKSTGNASKGKYIKLEKEGINFRLVRGLILTEKDRKYNSGFNIGEH